MSKGELKNLKRIKKTTVDGKEIHYWINKNGDETGKGRFKLAKLNKHLNNDLQYPTVLKYDIDNKNILTMKNNDFKNYIYKNKFNLFLLNKILKSEDNTIICKLNELILGPEIRKGYSKILDTLIMIINDPINNEYLSLRNNYNPNNFKSAIINIDGYTIIAIKSNNEQLDNIIMHILKSSSLLLQNINNDFLKINNNITNYNEHALYYNNIKEFPNTISEDEYIKWLQLFLIKQQIYKIPTDFNIESII